MLRDLLQEVRELGVRGTTFRIGWELRQRSGLGARLSRRPPPLDPRIANSDWFARLPFADPSSVATCMADRMPSDAIERLARTAELAAQGSIFCFGRRTLDYGDPIDWQLNPVTGQRWNRDTPWPLALADEPRVGDVKMTWEVARFPHAYHMARAAAFRPESAANWSTVLHRQFRQFTDENPFGRGVHWASGQETAFRLMAWLFALDALLLRHAERAAAAALVAEELSIGAAHIAENIDYARLAVYNNHLLSEAVALYVAGTFLPQHPHAARWRDLGRRVLNHEAHRQFSDDGAYIQLSHNYHRVALHTLLWAVVVARSGGDRPDESWLEAMDRSLAFLLAHQNPSDGRLPNYGANDGALPSIWSTCDFSDFRPVLQAVSVSVRGQRVYDAGPWDEPSVWLFGPSVLDLPLRELRQRSISYPRSGFHVLRGSDPSTFAAFRCGSIRDRFSQIDMLNIDIWWRGENVLVDGGSFQYNDADEWHDHFFRTASHNTVQLDGRDQMLHFRRFKSLYWTQARLLSFEDGPRYAICTGEHYGYTRHPGRCIHRRSVLFAKDDCWVVVDRIFGSGEHTVVLHWLAGAFPHRQAPDEGRLTIDTPGGPFSVTVTDSRCRPLPGTVVEGRSDPPRGWLARYYSERTPVPSLQVELRTAVPTTLVSVLGSGTPELTVENDLFTLRHAEHTVRFRATNGMITLANTIG